MASDKTIILITGASSGIGLETVLALAQESQDFEILLGSRSVEKGQKALEDLRSSHADSLKSSISVIQIDITDQKSILAAKEEIETRFERLDVLINNAGIIVTRPCDTLTNLRETFETNVFGPAIVTEAFEPLLRKSSSPRLIYVSSDQGSISNRLDPAYKYYKARGDHYRMSKSALNMLSACHRVNYAEFGFKVCAFNPGFCVTNLTGERGRMMRIEHGARDSRDAAVALVGVVIGKRDADIEKSGIVDLDGGVIPW
ncbi:putative short chain dehydrogenase protein [Phaeoacremonium minimum UCRPA7]|uniref:Putative short chain dehydrogenase protein n=1 Tax=Phaeoacremonium minimum (strain UCR-PA7) TaxID=1286976 RepID=R8BWX0_PHAM7|nr:putative short chain dehydrogenase protein [Phaeoacremonium minimum UCRPA7]EOO03848.1 putative short chain dehydrogenase protein [Phaeoacremonium minimum UCRPA7]